MILVCRTKGSPRPRVGVKPPPVKPEVCVRQNGAVGGCQACHRAGRAFKASQLDVVRGERSPSRACACPWDGATTPVLLDLWQPSQGVDLRGATLLLRQPAGTGRRTPGAFGAIRANFASIRRGVKAQNSVSKGLATS